MSGLVTVLIPAYNVADFIEESLGSVLAQTYRDLEILIVDDGSKDATPDILARHAAADSRIRVIRQANGGISAALNTGLAAAKGDLLARMDGDDIMLPDRIERQVAFLAANPDLGFCASSMEIIDEHGVMKSTYHPVPTTRDQLAAMIANEELITYTHPTVLARTALLRNVGGYDKRFEPCEDGDLWGKLNAAGHRGLAMPDILMRYRMHSGSISGSKVMRQVRMTEIVRANFYRRMRGDPVLLPAEWEAAVAAMPIGPRLALRRRLAGLALMQSARYDRAADRRFAAAGKIALTALLRPDALIRRLIS